MERSPRTPRVLHVVDDLTPAPAHRAVLAQVARTDRARYGPHLASLERRAAADLGALADEAGIPVHRLRHPRERGSLVWFRLAALVRALRPAVVHTHGATAGLIGRSVARVLGVRGLVTTLHDAIAGPDGDPFSRLGRETLALCDRVVAGSEAALAAAADAAPGLEVARVDDGVAATAADDLAGRRAAARAALGYADDDVVIGAAGRLDPGARLDSLVHAFALAAAERPRLRLLLVGEGLDLDGLEDLVQATGQATHVVRVAEASDVAGGLAAADVHAAPSTRAALGFGVVEAWAAGRPVLAARAANLPDRVADGVDGRLLPEGDPIAWSAALRALADDDAARRAMGEAARARAAGLDADATARALESLYDDLETPALERAA